MKLANAMGSLQALAFIVSSIRLRYTLQRLHRPFRLCGRAPPSVAALSLLFPFAMAVFNVFDAMRTFISAVLVVVFVIIGIVYTKQADFSKFQPYELHEMSTITTDGVLTRRDLL
ncbi:hypothetical protein PINS_up008329 [Pythium insidiosum]|nr:hypothetical protein PINS_up008329 [Pythium insidiosum]